MHLCVFCGRQGNSPFPPAPMRRHGWDWFTGYFDETAYCCPECRRPRHAQWMQLYDLAMAPARADERRRSMRASVVAVLERK
jgi:hypothetical protein